MLNWVRMQLLAYGVKRKSTEEIAGLSLSPDAVLGELSERRKGKIGRQASVSTNLIFIVC